MKGSIPRWKRRIREPTYEEAWHIIDRLAPEQRELLCKVAFNYFQSRRAIAMMAYLGSLPRGYIRLSVARGRLAHALTMLILTGEVVGYMGEEQPDLEEVLELG